MLFAHTSIALNARPIMVIAGAMSLKNSCGDLSKAPTLPPISKSHFVSNSIGVSPVFITALALFAPLTNPVFIPASSGKTSLANLVLSLPVNFEIIASIPPDKALCGTWYENHNVLLAMFTRCVGIPESIELYQNSYT